MAQLFTVGHSNRSLIEFINLLAAHHIKYLIDIRAIPRSRFVPWFNQQSLRAALEKKEIVYIPMPELGGRRHTQKDSINLGWRNKSFRGFADFMQTEEFFLALKKLNQYLKKSKFVAIMCAEAVPWRCHRSLIADAQIARGVFVAHIMNATTLHPHALTSFAKVHKNSRPLRVTYPKIE